MIVRDFEPQDELRLREIHADSGLDYPFPNLDSPLYIVKKVIEDDGEVRIAAVARLTVEVGVICDGEWSTPAFRFEAFKVLHEEMRRALLDKGMEDVHSWLPPQMKGFARRLCRMFGWIKSPWQCYERQL